MSLRVYTAHRSYRDKDGLNVTLRDQDPVGRFFAPDPETFRAYHARKQTGAATLADWTRYEAAYRAHLEAVPPEHWTALLVRRVVTLTCYCVEPRFCHRRVLAEALAARGAVYLGERPRLRRGDAAE